MNKAIEVPNNPHELHQYLLHVVSISKKSFVVIGKCLYHLKKNDAFKSAVGKGADKWEDYLKQPEIGLSAGEASRLMQIYEQFILRLGYDEETIAEVPVKNAHYLLPIAKKMEKGDDMDDLVACATILSQKDFKIKVAEKKAKELGITLKEYEYFIMQKELNSNTLQRVPDISSETLIEHYGLPTQEEI